MSADILGTKAETNAEARFNKSLRPRKPEGSIGRTAQDGHLDSHAAPELCDVSLHVREPCCRCRRMSLCRCVDRVVGVAECLFAGV